MNLSGAWNTEPWGRSLCEHEQDGGQRWSPCCPLTPDPFHSQPSVQVHFNCLSSVCKDSLLYSQPKSPWGIWSLLYCKPDWPIPPGFLVSSASWAFCPRDTGGDWWMGRVWRVWFISVLWTQWPTEIIASGKYEKLEITKSTLTPIRPVKLKIKHKNDTKFTYGLLFVPSDYTGSASILYILV